MIELFTSGLMKLLNDLSLLFLFVSQVDNDSIRFVKVRKIESMTIV